MPLRSAIEDLGNVRLFSIASVWEIAIKVSLGKLTLKGPFSDLVPKQLRENATELLPIRLEHTEAILSMPFQHRDPFDRMLVAQAQVERARLVSSDSILEAYGIERIW